MVGCVDVVRCVVGCVGVCRCRVCRGVWCMWVVCVCVRVSVGGGCGVWDTCG